MIDGTPGAAHPEPESEPKPDLDDRRRGGAPRLWSHRNLGLFAAVAAAFVVGMPVSRLLESYRGIVLEVQDERMYLAFAERPPRWLAAIATHPGAVLEKERGAWNTVEVETKARDLKLVQLYERYASSYDAVIVRIDPPLTPGMASTAVVDTSVGKRLRVPLWAEGLAAAAPGRHLRKLPGSWDPILLEESGAGASPHPP